MIIGSQIEGSMYKIDLLMRIIELCEKHDLLESQLHYPREEIVFSSLANALSIKVRWITLRIIRSTPIR